MLKKKETNCSGHQITSDTINLPINISVTRVVCIFKALSLSSAFVYVHYFIFLQYSPTRRPAILLHTSGLTIIAVTSDKVRLQPLLASAARRAGVRVEFGWPER